MRKTILFILLMFVAANSNAQELTHYLVFTFEKTWKKNRFFSDGGDYLWIVPLDSCFGRVPYKEKMMPLFILEYDLDLDLIKSDNGMIGIGYWAVDECDYINEPGMKILKQNRKLVQQIKTCYTHPKDERTISVYITPISAKCKIRGFGIHNFPVCTFETPLDLERLLDIASKRFKKNYVLRFC
ncbi:MAG: hypothetical protein J5676_01195 [Bacteroidaceae bacterium]|nr:hypothetical protein [Bacteroidaceae bacterium]